MAQVKGIVNEFFLHDTSSRIRRSKDARWANGYAVNPLMPGYRRIATNPNTEDPKKRGPFRDERDEKLTPIIVEGYHMAARGESVWRIAEYFDAQRLPMSDRANTPKWTAVRARGLIQHPLYKGVECYRKTTTKALEVTGQSRQVRSPEDQVLKREMPHLAHVPMWLWEKANQAIKSRRTQDYPENPGCHPNQGTPRDRWGPLSAMFYCGVCGSRLHRDGAGYRCSASKKRWTKAQGTNGRCWNRCSPDPSLVHANIGAAIVDELLRHAGGIATMKPLIDRLITDGDGSRESRVRDLELEKARLTKAIKKLSEAVETASEIPELIVHLKKRQSELDAVNNGLLELQELAPVEVPIPTLEEIETKIERIKPLLLDTLGREAGAILRQLVGRIEARPYRAFDSDRVVLRAHFELKLIALLPSQWQSFMAQRRGTPDAIEIEGYLTIPMVVDLFKRPQFVRHAWDVYRMADEGKTLQEITKDLGIGRDVAKAAKRLAKLMKSISVEEVYTPLIEKPAELPTRWSRDDSAAVDEDNPRD